MGEGDHEILLKVSGLIENLDFRNLNFSIITEKLVELEIAPLQFIDCILNVYVRNNFVGPPFDLPWDSSTMDNLAFELLSVDGETPFPLVRNLSLLWLCKTFSQHMMKSSRIMSFRYTVNYLKCIYLHQNIYSETRCPSLKSNFDDILEEVDINTLEGKYDQDSFLFCLLGSFMAVFYYDFDLAGRFSELCGSILGVEINQTALLGTRTKAQENALAQLVINIKRINDEDLSHYFCNESTAQPKICALEDDNLLDFVKFRSDSSLVDQKLTIAEQAFILCSGEIHRRSYPHDELIDEQSLAYVSSILRLFAAKDNIDDGEDQHRSGVSWPLLTEALYKRGSYERRSLSRTERTIRQLEELTAQFTSKIPAANDRGIKYFFWSRMPSYWQIELSHARILTKIGSTKSALDIYLRWEQWDEIIDSYTSLGKRDLAEKVIRERIANGHETPELYCCLGDVTSNPSHYEIAWELSKHRSARAVRSLGYYAFKKDKDVKKATEYFELSLEINRFQVDLWFTLGCCYLQIHDFPKAERAFRFSVTLEPDNYEAWNNLASAVIFSGRRSQALTLLKEATKWNFQSWRLWENILLVGVDEGAFKDVINAFHRLIDLRHKHTDPQVLGILTKAVCEDIPDNKNLGASRLRQDLLSLFGHATATNPMDADTWRHYANLLLNTKGDMDPTEFQRAVQYVQKSYQCRLRSATPDWEFDKTIREDLLVDLQAMVKLLVPTDSLDKSTYDSETKVFINSTLSSLRMNINVYMARLKSAISKCVDGGVKEELGAVTKLLSDMHDKVNVALSV